MKSFSDPEVLLFIFAIFIPVLFPGAEKDFDYPERQSGSLARGLDQLQNGWQCARTFRRLTWSPSGGVVARRPDPSGKVDRR
jgi:hypothetical protein